MMNLALYAISAALLAGGPSDPPRDESTTTAQAQASPDEGQPVRAAQDDSSGFTQARPATQPRRGDMAAEERADLAATSDPGLNDSYFSQQQIWTAE